MCCFSHEAQEMNQEQKVQLLKGRDIPFKRSGTLSNLFEPRAQLYRMFLDTGDELLKLDESNFREEMESQASVIAEFLGVSVSDQEI